MDTVYGPATDPVPFFLAAFGLGALGIVGFLVWTFFERRKLRMLLAAVKGTKP